jgi:hypothetical protein
MDKRTILGTQREADVVQVLGLEGKCLKVNMKSSVRERVEEVGDTHDGAMA